MMAVAVKAFVVEAIWKSVSSLAGTFSSTFASPYAFSLTTLPSRMTTTATAGRWRFRISART